MNDPTQSEGATRPDHIHLDVLGGIAGDMFIAALLDARPDLAAGTIDAIRAAGLPVDWTVAPEPGRDGGLVGTRMRIDPPEPRDDARHHEYGGILRSLADAPLDGAVRARAVEIMRSIAEAEAEIHGVAIDEVVLHEVGALDSIADVVGAAHLIEALSPASWSISPLPIGGGFVETAHGRLPVPAPATQLLLRGFPFVDDGVSGERITPTGAAILRHLDPSFGLPDGWFTSAETGQGLGARTLPGVANMLRARFYTADRNAAADEQVVVIEFLVDDQTPEDLAIGLTAVRSCSGVLDVLQTPVTTKKGRLGHAIQVIAAPDARDQAIQVCFEETTTIGLRYRFESRKVLPRRETIGPDGVSVKVVERPDGGSSAKADMDVIASKAAGHGERQQLRQQAEAAALSEDEDG